jgi:hypothetical protein
LLKTEINPTKEPSKELSNLKLLKIEFYLPWRKMSYDPVKAPHKE